MKITLALVMCLAANLLKGVALQKNPLVLRADIQLKKLRMIVAICCLGLVSMLSVSANVQSTFYASPTGSGNVGSLASPCSLTGVRDLIRTINTNMTGDIVVNLRGGVYNLTASFQLIESADIHDSGTNGFNIIYQAYPGEIPIISGGVPVTGWTLYDHDKNIYRAKVDASLQTRQFYVDGRRAIRARSPGSPAGWKKTAAGWEIKDETMQNWGNQSDIEIVDRDAWKQFHCGIASIVGTQVTMKNPCWANSSNSPNPGKPWNGAGLKGVNGVSWIENAYELLTAPGQWYLDRSAGYLHYIPLEGEDMSTVSAVVPRLEQLLDVRGSGPKMKIHNLEFIGLTFAYGTWLQPSGDQGYADNQAGIVWLNTPPVSAKTAGNLSFQYAGDIRLERNVVTHMGGVAIDFGHGPQRNTLLGNCIHDISGGGIYMGEVDDYATTDPEAMTDSNTIKDNYITQVGVEYEDQVGIWVGYTRNLLLDHNEIGDVPYSGISVGWGWGKTGYSLKNTFTNNFVHDYMKVLNDGGGIYTLSNQGDADNKTVWSGNYVVNSNHGEGYYADEGSGWMDLKNNVALHIGEHWVYLWTSTIHDVAVHDNFSDSSNMTNKGANCPMADNVLDVKGESLPDAAQAIIKNAGLEPAYANIKVKIPPPESTTYNDNDSTITYEGDWTATKDRNMGDIGNDVHFTKTDGASATFAFSGQGIEYLAEYNNDEGQVDVYMDGSLIKTVDCQNPARLAQKTAYDQKWDQAGPHTIKIVKKSGGYMLLDAFKVHHAVPRADKISQAKDPVDDINPFIGATSTGIPSDPNIRLKLKLDP